MKGLLLKDLKLMLNQKKFFIMMLVIAIIIAFSSNNPSFVLGYMTFFISIIALSTINYDEFNNGYTFLFTLPFTKKDYTLEKYILTYLTAFISWIFSMLLSAILYIILDGSYNVRDGLIEGISTLMIFIIILSIMLPIKLKAGIEKSNIVQSLLMGIIFIFILGINLILDLFNIDLSSLIIFLERINIYNLILALFIIVTIITVISYFISIKIMDKKEF
ncbi:MAG: ABC-2 transporter permease [Bacilli bacterium]|nr:ABC-2 transporter permease [Bacilli bacterium]